MLITFLRVDKGVIVEGYEVTLVIGQQKTTEEEFADVSNDGKAIPNKTLSEYLIDLKKEGWSVVHETGSEDNLVRVVALVRPKD